MIILEDEYGQQGPVSKWGKRLAYGLGGAAALIGANHVLPGGIAGSIENTGSYLGNAIPNVYRFGKNLITSLNTAANEKPIN